MLRRFTQCEVSACVLERGFELGTKGGVFLEIKDVSKVGSLMVFRKTVTQARRGRKRISRFIPARFGEFHLLRATMAKVLEELFATHLSFGKPPQCAW